MFKRFTGVFGLQARLDSIKDDIDSLTDDTHELIDRKIQAMDEIEAEIFEARRVLHDINLLGERDGDEDNAT